MLGLSIGAVPMPSEIAAWIAAFVDEFHVEQVFHKRKRDRANVDRKPDYDPSGGRKDDV